MPASIASMREKSETTHPNSSPSGISRTSKKKWRGREIVDDLDADDSRRGSDPVDPDASGLLVAFRFGVCLGRGFLFRTHDGRRVCVTVAFLVAMVCFVIDDDDAANAPSVAPSRAGSSHLRFRGNARRTRSSASRPWQHLSGSIGDVDLRSPLERVIVGDHDPGLSGAPRRHLARGQWIGRS